MSILDGSKNVVIVGGGICGWAAARELRLMGFTGRVILVMAEGYLPYERPPLSKEILQGSMDIDGALIAQDEWYAENAIEKRIGDRAVRLSLKDRTVTLACGEVLKYWRLLLATGGSPRKVKFGSDEGGGRVMYLRDISDCMRLKEFLRWGRRLVIVGGGLIGTEVAASAVQRGLEVCIVEPFDTPLAGLAGEDIGRMIMDIHSAHGVRFVVGDRVRTINASPGGVSVITEKNQQIACDGIVIAVGMVPNTGLARAAGLDTRRGVLVDEFCRTSDASVFAAGDVAEHWHPRFDSYIITEHYQNAILQGAVAARNLMGEVTEYCDPHWAWSIQYDERIDMVGIRDSKRALTLYHSKDNRRAIGWQVGDGGLRFVIGVNCERIVRRARRLIGGSGLVAKEFFLEGIDV